MAWAQITETEFRMEDAIGMFRRGSPQAFVISDFGQEATVDSAHQMLVAATMLKVVRTPVHITISEKTEAIVDRLSKSGLARFAPVISDDGQEVGVIALRPSNSRHQDD